MQVINLDLSVKGVIPLLQTKQGDVGRKFKAVLTDGGEAYPVPAGAAVSVWYSGASGAGNYTDIGAESAVSVSGNEITVELITQMLANPGKGVVCLVLSTAGGDELGMWNINYHVEPRPGINSVAAQEYYTAFSKAVSELAYPDSSLSVAGKAADAAATGAALAGKAPAGFGLGATGKVKTIQDISELDTIVENGWYSVYAPTLQYISGIAFHSITLEVSMYNSVQGCQTVRFLGNNVVCKRAMYSGAWRDWEFDNPPMEIGVEYRTTERYNGKVVYAQTINVGTPANGGYIDYVGGDKVIRHSANLSNLSLPYTTTGSYSDRDAIAVTVTNTRITIYCGESRAGYGTVHATVWYTKA